MTKLTKNQKLSESKIDREKLYTLTEASTLVKEITKTKFDASIDLDVRLGIDPRKSNRKKLSKLPLVKRPMFLYGNLRLRLLTLVK